MSKKQKPTPKPKATTNTFSWLPYIHMAVIAIVAFALYAQTLGFDFVYHDDDTMIVNNTAVLQNATLKTAFTTDAWFREQAIELYRPWQSLTYIFDYKLWQAKPTGYHLHNVLVFIAGLLLLYHFLQRIHFSRQWALLLTLFYATHYLFAHTVSWIPARGDLYLTAFGLATALLFLSYMQKPSAKTLVLANVLLLLALFAKETAIVILPVVMLLRWVELKFDFKQLKSVVGIWVLPSLLPIGLYLAMRHNAIAQMPYVSFGGGLYNLPVIPESVFKFFVPYVFCVLPGYTSVLTIAGSIVIALMVAAIVLLRKTENIHLLLAGLAMFLLALFPSLFYKPNFSGFAYDYLDHRMFFAGIGLLVFVGALLTSFPTREKILQYVLMGLCVVEAGFSFMYQPNYTDYHHYYQNGMQCNPKSALAMLNYGILLRVRENKLQESADVLHQGLQVYPDSMMFMNELAGDYFRMGKLDSMFNAAQQMAKYPGWQYEALVYKGIYYSEKQQLDTAIATFGNAIVVKPEKPDGYLNRAKLYRKQNNINSAMADLDEAIRLNPGYADALFERGNVFGNLGYFDKAAADFERCVAVQPTNRDAYFYLGQAYIFSNRKVQGCAALQQAADMGQPDAAAKMGQLCR